MNSSASNALPLCWNAKRLLLALVVATSLSMVHAAWAQGDGGELPRTSIAPADSSGTLATPSRVDEGAPGAGEGASTHSRVRVHHRTAAHHPAHEASARESNTHFEVDPAKARLLLKRDSWAYERPSKRSRTVERMHGGKYVNVTGTTRYYLRIKLKSGKVAYVSIGDVQLVKPNDRLFRLTSNAAVVAEPNRWGKKLSEVHRGHDVHVVGVALNYVKIKMKDGLEGFIPMSAMQ